MIYEVYILKNGLPVFTHTNPSNTINFNAVSDKRNYLDDSRVNSEETSDSMEFGNFKNEDSVEFDKDKKDSAINEIGNRVIPKEQLTMVAGFFSAINSFATKVGNFGTMHEIKMENIKFCFYQPEQAENLLIIGASALDAVHEETYVFLKEISRSFLYHFPSIAKNPWNGKTDEYKDFSPIIKELFDKLYPSICSKTPLTHNIFTAHGINEDISTLQGNDNNICNNNCNMNNKSEIKRTISEEIDEIFANDYTDNRVMEDKLMPEYNDVVNLSISNFNNRELSKRLKDINEIETNRKLNGFNQMRESGFLPYSKEVLYNIAVPIKTIDDSVDINYLFTGKDSAKVFKAINGYNTIENISAITGLTQERTYNLCKNFIKMGLISFTG